MGERAARACTRNAVGVGEHARAHNITILQLILLIWVQCKAHLIYTQIRNLQDSLEGSSRR